MTGRLMMRLRFGVAEWALRKIVAGRCNAYGGTLRPSGVVRLCDKPRWHTDSHFYALALDGSTTEGRE